MTKIIVCKCMHAYQDEHYGKSKRVHNYSSKKKAWVCTVCNAPKDNERSGD